MAITGNMQKKLMWGSPTPPTEKDISVLVRQFLGSEQRRQLEYLHQYYCVDNVAHARDHAYKRSRHKTPNWYIPSAYYKTVVDTMAGYMFNGITYVGGGFARDISTLYADIDIGVTDMQSGIRALAYNKGCEIVYTRKNPITEQVQLDVVSLDPREIVCVYDTAIEPQVLFALRIVPSPVAGEDYIIEYISATEWSTYKMYRSATGEDVVTRDLARKNEPLFFDECPVIEYTSDVLGAGAPFAQVLPLIDALDALISGNSNELDKLADALLVISKEVAEEDKERIAWWRIIDNFDKDGFVQYLQRQISPEFRDFLYKVLVQEIHKHAHVIDFYSDAAGIAGDATGKALRIRLTDMSIYADRIETIYRVGISKRLRLFKQLFSRVYNREYASDDTTKIVFTRTQIVRPEDVAPLLVGVDFISQKTKQELSGVNPAEESERLAGEREEGEDITDDIIQDTDADNGGERAQ